MEVYSFRTVRGPSEGLYREKGSKFFAFAFPVRSEADITGHLDSLRRKYFDATHHCFAWMLGPEKKVFRCSDDGEPAHSAGDPILGRIRSADLTNVLVVVVRYFGGTRLGVGGLIAAYRTAAELALNHAVVTEEEVTEKIDIHFPYTATPEVMRLVRQFDLTIEEQHFENDCRISVRYNIRHRGKVADQLSLLRARGILS